MIFCYTHSLVSTLSRYYKRLPPKVNGNRSRDPQLDILWKRNLSWKSPSNPLPQKSRNLQERRWKIISRKEWRTTGENGPLSTTEKSASELTETEVVSTAYTGLHQALCVLEWLAQYFSGVPDSESKWLSVVPALGTLADVGLPCPTPT